MREIEVFSLPCFREPMSSLTHLLGAVVFSALAVVLVRRGRGDWCRTASLMVMALSTVQLLVLSGTYHMFWPGPLRQFMVRADVSGVFLLIAGSLTPVHVILFRGVARWGPLVLVWTVAIIGIILRMVFFDSVSGEAGIAIFLLFGWGAAITAAVLFQRYGWAFVRAGVLAGLAYTAGAIVLALHRPTLVTGLVGPHELWHLAVLTGLGLHWRFVFQFASGLVPEETHEGTEAQALADVPRPHFQTQSARSKLARHASEG